MDCSRVAGHRVYDDRQLQSRVDDRNVVRPAGIFWFLFGAVFLLSYRFSQLKPDMLTEMKRMKLSVLELKEALARDTKPS